MGQPGEEAQLDQFRRRGIQRGQLVQGLVQGQQVLVGQRRSDPDLVQVHPLQPPPCRTRALRRARSTRMRRMASAAAPKKWRRPSHFGSSSPPAEPANPQPGLMDQRGGLQRLAGLLPGKLPRGQAAQLSIDQGQQFLRRVGFPPLDRPGHLTRFVHWRESGSWFRLASTIPVSHGLGWRQGVCGSFEVRAVARAGGRTGGRGFVRRHGFSTGHLAPC